jgi:hypothetical protein
MLPPTTPHVSREPALVSNEDAEKFWLKAPGVPGDAVAAFTFDFTEGKMNAAGTAPMGEDQAVIIAAWLDECFGGRILPVVRAARSAAGPVSFPHLAGCSRCGKLHETGGDPPMDWPPLVETGGEGDGAVWGIVCPDCRIEVGDGTIVLKVARPWLRALRDPDVT